MLPIRQILNALPTSALNRTPKAVLIEVCRLAELDAQGWCTAKNEYLIQCLGGTERTMSRTLTLLEQRGLLCSQGQGKARRLAPTATLRACYAAPDEASRTTALTALNLDKSGHQPRQNEPTNLDKNGAEPRQNGEVDGVEPRQKWYSNLDKSGHQPRQNGSRVYGDQVYQDSTSTPPTPEEWAGAQKKINDLEAEVSRLQAENLRLAPPIAAPPQPADADRGADGMLPDGHPALYGGYGQPKPATDSHGPRYSDASKALAAEMAKVWKLTPMPRHGGDWGLLHRFAHQKEQAGQLAEVRKQFTGFALFHQKRDIEPLGLEKFLGSEAGGFEGKWCQVDWPAKAQAARANGESGGHSGPPPTPTQATINLKRAAAQQQHPVT